ncbi:AraC family transcriptional regulator [Pseudalkalibacillus hwajinpoensis]|uniref:AraC family transcriptional regulator n=1 Tax=Guptibacillus hwajinpoensis TaxID=208199 RepID=UPI001CD248A3|nr:AraC family transcriptional regulator [Pseudalkalibacillus hwajinpoensis]MCA0991926.1 AraC family transcriptional regulator [Pseudalkalibacillus hwajinpoensis]
MSAWLEDGSFDWTEDSLRLSLNPSKHTVNSYLYIQEVGHFKAYSSYFTERHNLESYLIIYTRNGEGRLFYQNEEYLLEPNTICFIDCRNHQYYQTSKELWEFYWVHINGSQVENYYLDFSQDHNVCTTVKDNTAQNIIRTMINLQKHKTRSLEIITAREIVNLLTLLMIEKTRSNYNDETKIPTYIFDIQSFFEENYSKKITLDDLSRRYKLNKYQIAKTFKSSVGITPIEYLIETRINKSKDLLKYTDLPINEITYQIGIDNVTHYINLFKKRVGTTPLKFRNSWK